MSDVRRVSIEDEWDDLEPEAKISQVFDCSDGTHALVPWEEWEERKDGVLISTRDIRRVIASAWAKNQPKEAQIVKQRLLEILFPHHVIGRGTDEEMVK